MQIAAHRSEAIKYLRLVLACLPILFFPVRAFALSQRMAIAPGSYPIEPHSQATVQAYCVDFTRDTPDPSTNFAHVLTPSDHANVMVGSRTMDLQTALNQQDLAVTGRNLGIDDLFAAAEQRYSKDPAKLAEIKREEGELTPSERADLEKKNGLPAPDHTHVILVNRTDEAATIEVKQPIVLSEQDEPVRDFPLPALSQRNREPSDIQNEIWRKAESVREMQLAALGFPVVEGTGSPDAEKASVREFQQNEDLPATGEIDSATEQRLRLLAHNQRSLDIINTKPHPKCVAAIIQSGLKRADAKLYCLSWGMGHQSCADSVCALAKTLSDLAVKLDASQAYLIPERLDANSTTALAASLRNCDRNDHYPTSLDVVDRDNSEPLEHNPYFARRLVDIRDDNDAPVLVQLPSGDYYRRNITLDFPDGANEEAEVYGKTRPILSRFVATIKGVFLGLQTRSRRRRLSDITAADVISLAVKDMGVDKDQIRFEIRNVQYVEQARGLRAFS
jgi:hypothetical protein